ncbi:MAG: Gfo/Idh/MocA family oxidoreductase [Candidatus Omnitrophota bacterium]
MSEKKNVTRREFINRSGKVAAGVGAAVLAGPAIGVQGANDKIRMGIIGPGKRGGFLMEQTQRVAEDKNIPLEFIAVADIFEGWREKGIATAERTAESEVKGYDDHRKLLANKDVDAVIIATPEHLHAQQMLDVIAAGKDLYVEKPMVHTIEEGKKVVKSAKLSKCIIQCGTMRRSVPLYYMARDMVKNGEIGQVNYCEGWWHRNFKEGQPNAAWQYQIPDDASEDNIIWKEFIGPAPFAPFDLKRYFQWRCFWDYSNGIGSDLMVHQMDVINLVMSAVMPKSVVSSGDIYRWKDGRTSCDTWSSVFEYDEGFQANYRSNFSTSLQQYGIRICGTDGTIEILQSMAMTVTPEPENLRVNKNLEKKTYYFPEDNEKKDEMYGHISSVQAHIHNFLECIKSRKTPNCDVETGFYGSALSSMAVEAYHKGRRLVWDKQKQEVIEA